MKIFLKIKFFIYYYFNLGFQYCLNEKKIIQNSAKNASSNNYKIGLIMLKQNKFVDALFRFKLAKFFYKKSSNALNYNIAYSYFLLGNIQKSLLYLKLAIEMKPNYHRSILLFKKIYEIENLKSSISSSDKIEKS